MDMRFKNYSLVNSLILGNAKTKKLDLLYFTLYLYECKTVIFYDVSVTHLCLKYNYTVFILQLQISQIIKCHFTLATNQTNTSVNLVENKAVEIFLINILLIFFF